MEITSRDKGKKFPCPICTGSLEHFVDMQQKPEKQVQHLRCHRCGYRVYDHEELGGEIEFV